MPICNCVKMEGWHVSLSIFNQLKARGKWQKDIPSVISQKGESQNGCFKKAKHAKISEKLTFLQGVRNVGFSEILACFAFLKHPF